ncbi:50S ribosomal protein L6 [Cocleimonas flava]|uniref:Large ribosomal subunit protein uL6 n=1 Tax=Cocleimonas flava TaxID=634765 RepID=A0A4R1EXQ9_9GAMM|nr:50S ribosomal protein L6 [Cocleimonas flava]TCJ82771.1 LSU ribosomal protein L6P [Cocleimonas flava]
MSRIAKMPIDLPAGVEAKINGQNINIKGGKGAFDYTLNNHVEITQEGSQLVVKPKNESNKKHWAMAGTMRAITFNMVTGVSDGFEKKLELVGVGYRAQAQGNKLNLTLGFSHPVVHDIPEGVTVETPSQTEIILRGIDKQVIGQTAAEIRSYRPPEPYKGKGVKYADERIIRKEAKKT